MTLATFLVNAATVIAALLSGLFWTRAAYAKVVASSDSVGVGYGGNPINVRDHAGVVVDFMQTYALQSKWNSRAALMSGIAGVFGAVALLLHQWV